MSFIFVLGTRPEAIKLAPVIIESRRRGLEVLVCSTGQHRDLVNRSLEAFELEPDVDLAVMTVGQTLPDLTARLITRLDPVMRTAKPRWVIIQGDTTSAFAGALAAFYNKIPTAHVEAGLRTGEPLSPWPEEMNRRLISQLAAVHFPPTAIADTNLAAEGVPAEARLVTGNSGIDALRMIVARLEEDDQFREQAQDRLRRAGVQALESQSVAVVTLHRREIHGSKLPRLVEAILQCAELSPQWQFHILIHPNPEVATVLTRAVAVSALPNVRSVPPLDYPEFVWLLKRAALVITDSGGIQEEAPTLGTRVLVLRDNTERAEGLSGNLVSLVGTDPGEVRSAINHLLASLHSVGRTPEWHFGDGRASARIVERLLAHQDQRT